MISYSFSIPHGKKAKTQAGSIPDLVKVIPESIGDFIPRFDTDPANRVVVEASNNTDFSLVYNK